MKGWNRLAIVVALCAMVFVTPIFAAVMIVGFTAFCAAVWVARGFDEDATERRRRVQ